MNGWMDGWIVQVVPKVLEAEQREMDEMRALMDAGQSALCLFLMA